MSVREYVGARYVPIVVGEWDNTRTYEPLMVVTYQGNSYTSRQYVPTGIEITNESYWVLSANYNAQVESYRQEVRAITPLDSAPTQSSTKGVTSGGVYEAITEVSDALDAITPLDSTPTQGSTKGVTSGGVYEAIENAVPTELEAIIPFDSTPTQGSTKGVTSGGVYEAIDTAKTELGTTIESGISSIEGGLAALAVQTTRLYVMATTGDDDTGDGTQDKPFKTLQGARNYLVKNGIYYALRVYLAEAGTYEFPENANSCELLDFHCTATVPNVTLLLQPPSTAEFAFYGGHINLAGSVSGKLHLSCTGTTITVADGGNFIANYCTFDKPLRGFNSSLVCTYCDLVSLSIDNAQINLQNVSFTLSASLTTPVINSRNSMFRFSGTFTITTLNTTTITNVLAFSGGVLSFSGTLSTTIQNATNFMYIEQTLLFITQARLEAIQAVTGVTTPLSQTRSLIVTGNQTLPITS